MNETNEDDKGNTKNEQMDNNINDKNEVTPKILSLKNLRENDEFKQLCYDVSNEKKLSSNLDGPSNRKTPINEGDEKLYPSFLFNGCGRSKNNSPLIKDNESKVISKNNFKSLVNGSLEKASNNGYVSDPLNYINFWSQRNSRYEYPDNLFTGHKIYSHFFYPEELSDTFCGKLDYPMGNITHNYIGVKNIDSEQTETLANNEVNSEYDKDLMSKYKYRNRVPNPTNVCQAISIACELKYLPTYIFDNIKNSYITTICLSNNLLQNIPESIGLMKNLKYLDVSCNRLVTLPKTISKCYNLVTLDVSNNLITHFPDNLGLLKKKLEAFYIFNNPLRYDLMHVLSSSDPGKILLEILQKRFYSKQNPPPRREWTFLTPLQPVDNHPNLPFISVMTYNILSYKYLFNNRFNYCPDEELKWEYRKAVIFEEISHYSPAIVTMQEVPKGDYESYFHPKLCESGYDGLFLPKSRIKKTKEELTQHVDGCAIFWQKPLFSYILHLNLEFKSLVDELFKEDDEKSKRIQSFDNVALVVALAIKGEEPEGEPDKTLANGVYYRPLVIATTHIHWDPEYADVKLIQSMLLMRTLFDKRRFISNQLRCNIEEIPIIVTGDFNSRPRSSVLEYIRKKQLRKDDDGLMLFKNCENLDRINSNPKDSLYYHHGLKDLEVVDMSKYEFTNFTPEFSDVIDYIFYTSTTLNACGIIEPPSSEWIKNSEVIGFPHPHFPSDHIPIVANFYVKK